MRAGRLRTGDDAMRTANTQLAADRRNEILDAARRCFVRSGFHAASMQEICAEAAMSPGNLYRYFASKEDLIAGIAERDRAEVAAEFAAADVSQGLFTLLEGMAHHHFSQRPDEQVLLCTEVMSQARRHPDIAAISQNFDRDVRRWLRDLLEAGAKRGDIPADVNFDPVITMLMIIADGVWWRRALQKDFDPESVLPIFMDITRHMLRAKPKAVATDKTEEGAR
jgi:AcrR family transcriptional regulator